MTKYDSKKVGDQLLPEGPAFTGIASTEGAANIAHLPAGRYALLRIQISILRIQTPVQRFNV
jgi:hypothetical protein